MASRREAKKTEYVEQTANADLGNASSRPKRNKTVAAVTMPAEESKPTRTLLPRKAKTDKGTVPDNMNPIKKSREKTKTAKAIEPKNKSEKTKESLTYDVNEKKVIERKTRSKTTVAVKKAARKEPTFTAKSKVMKPIAIEDNVTNETKKMESKKKNSTKRAHTPIIENESDTIPQITDEANIKSRKRNNAEPRDILVTEIPDKKSRDRVNQIKTEANNKGKFNASHL